uniref:Mitotic checkpoint serine/threonine-protein kinase BUB1 beta n=1 Tax=Lygus hesperus TaxID=30085 RepID=A0A0A9YES2_LYGHE
MDAETLDLCKENIQPLKQGRRANKLGLALLAQNDVEIQEQLLKEREQYELEIMTYDGSDPLEPRYSYVHWIEQSCPKHGREVNLIPLLEDTIMLFKEDDRYKQDTRFIELIVKYIETQENPIELYQMVYAQGLGTKCASFYKAWADQLDMINDLQRADQVFQLGLSENAEPKEVVEQAHLRFQMSVGRRMMMGQLASREKSVSTETAERQRQVLGKIKKGGSHRPSSGLPGKLPLLPANRPLSGNSASTFTVFQEDENGLPLSKSTKAKLKVNAEATHKENTVKPGPWNQGFKRRPAPQTPSTPVPSTPTFKVLVDEVDETSSKPVTATPVPANVLKTRKAELKHDAQELFKSPHPNSKSHLPVFEAFAGGREFCFEELRWAYLCKKMGQAKSGLLDATPIKTNKTFSTPGKCSLMSPAPMTPLRLEELTLEAKTPACNRIMYPIMESPPSREADNTDDCRASREPTAPSNTRSNTPAPVQSNEDGVYAIPNTPAGLSLSSMATPSTSKPGPTDTPHSIISRPKIPKPVKTAPFTIYTDD